MSNMTGDRLQIGDRVELHDWYSSPKFLVGEQGWVLGLRTNKAVVKFDCDAKHRAVPYRELRLVSGSIRKSVTELIRDIA